tara:strand:- start:3206 stop:4156 length:951 start_codon:yes stop_codon:yes gene_type:complete
MNNSKLSPITIFGYDRPDHLNNLLESLVKNKESRDSSVYFYIDGKNEKTNITNYNKTIEIAQKNWGFKEKEVIVRDRNFGCRDNIIEGISEVINKHKKTIILEDDLIVSKNFLDYMNNCLEVYKDKKNIWHINGYSHPKFFYLKSTTAVSSNMSPWGWGTWEDRWAIFIDGQFHERNYISEKTPSMIKKFNVSNLYDFENIIVKHQQGEGSIWDAYWYQGMFLNNGLSIFPSMSHVQNYGFDGTGLHCGENEEFDTKLNPNKTKKYTKKNTISYFYGLSYRFFYRKIKFKNYIDYHKDKFLSFNAFFDFLKKKIIG